jgi:hypothetical protein
MNIRSILRAIAGEPKGLQQPQQRTPDDNLKPLTLYSKWICNVARSGFHNGAACNSADPHSPSWACGYRYEMIIFATGRDKSMTVYLPQDEDYDAVR